MDEPASGLINAEIDELDLIIRRLVDEYAIGVILIEHRLELLSAVADSCVVLDLGEVIASGDPRTVFEEPRVRAAYFESADA
jgi:ABC-type branched-subunit amino acid transport system ATPase component